MYEDLDRIRCLETRMRKRQLLQPPLEVAEQKEEEAGSHSKAGKPE